MSVLVCRL